MGQQPIQLELVRVAGVEPAWTCAQNMWVAATLHPEYWWLVAELNRVHRLFRPALCRRVHEPKLVDGARIELALRGCRPRVIPLYEPPNFGVRYENRTRVSRFTASRLNHSANLTIEPGAGRVNRTLVGEVQALCTATVVDQQTFGAGAANRTRVACLPCTHSATELCQRS